MQKIQNSTAYRLIFITLICLHSAFSLKANESTQISDSLFAITADYSGKVRIDSLNEHLAALVHMNFKLDSALYQKVYDLAVLSDHQEGIARLNYMMGLSFYNQSMFRPAMDYLDQSLIMANELGNKQLAVRSKIVIAESFLSEGKNQEALNILLVLKEDTKENNMDLEYASTVNSLASVYSNTFAQDKAVTLYLEALSYFESVEDYKTMGVVYNNLGTSNMQLGNNVQALQNMKEAEVNSLKVNDFKNLANLYIGMGILYNHMDSIELSVAHYKKSIEYNLLTGNKIEVARAYTNLGNLFKEQNDFDKALVHFQESMNICEEIGLDYGILINHINLAALYLEKEDFEKALEHYLMAEQLNEIFQIDNFTLPILVGKYRCYHGLGDYKNAFYYSRKTFELNDSINKLEQQERIVELQLQYEAAKDEAKMLELEQKVLTQTSTERLYVIVGLAIAILLGGINFYSVSRKRKAAFLQKQAEIQLENTKLELEFKKRELVSNALYLSNVYETIGKAEHQIKTIAQAGDRKQKEELKSLGKTLKKLVPSKTWEEFETRFEQVHTDFSKELLQRHPNLSPSELRVCSLLKLSLSTKEIANLTQRSVRTIDNTRFSIRKKLNLESEENLVTYLTSV